ncbi:RelA/SpoT family protein [Flavobacteriaceae bacterium Ap0902]|nr:RelA/SpoT family protein [Flavobacteriaceae bacterium Ap0902]
MTEQQLELENKEIALRYKQMLNDTYRHLTDDDKVLIRKAFDLALDAHKDQRRKTGEPYIYHPIAVAKIVADEIGLGATSIAAALMHDVVEDTDYTLEDIEGLFGKKIAKIIDGLTKISVLNNQELSIQSENFRKLLLTLSEDVRVIIIKIADRLHNMRTLGAMPESKQRKIASETIYIYAPLAHRMGLYNIKTELEDLSLKFTEPDRYFEIAKKLKDSEEERKQYIHEFKNMISAKLDEEGLRYQIKGRPKSIHSINKKMNSQGVPFEEVFDKFAIRIIYNSDRKNEKFLAWKIYSLVTDVFNPNPARLRDWITHPKSTGYESLHTTVMGPEGKWIEVQIRSTRMDEIAEKGIAAHYKYKENYEVEDSKVDQWITQVREILENQDLQNTSEFIDNFKLNLYAKEIYVFTPQGDILSLPKDASSLDFAYAIHTNVGDTCLGAKVNGKLRPLSYKLKSGDQVEIITSSNQKPKQDWLDFVITSRAKSKIKSALNAEIRERAEEGKEILERKLRHLRTKLTEKMLNDMVIFFKENSSQSLFLHVKEGIISNTDLKRFVDRNTGVTGFINRFRKNATKSPLKKKEETQGNVDLIVFGSDHKRLDYTLANCCNPIPGDKVFGFTTVSRGIKVHKMACPNAVELRANYSYRVLEANWVDSSTMDFKTTLIVQGIDRMGLVKDITDVLSNNLHINIKGLKFSSDDGIFKGEIDVVVSTKSHLDVVIEKVNKVEGVNKVKRQD